MSCNGQLEILDAIISKNTNALKDALRSGSVIDYIEHIGLSPLQVAVIVGFEETVDILIAHGADVNYSSLSATPLELACGNLHSAAENLQYHCGTRYFPDERPKIVRKLLEHGADINHGADFNQGYSQTPLVAAATHDQDLALKLLLQAGPSIDNCFMALSPAVFDGNERAVGRLVRFLSTHDIPDDKNILHCWRTSVVSAASLGNISIFCSLIEMSHFHTRRLTISGYALLSAAAAGQIDVVEYLLSSEVRLNINFYVTPSIDPHFNILAEQLEARKTAVVLAAKHGHREIVELLLANGANIDGNYSYMDNSGVTALTEAIANGQQQIAAILLDHGASVKLGTPMLRAIDWEDLGLIFELARKGANLDEALVYACENGKNKIVEHLLSADFCSNEKEKASFLSQYASLSDGAVLFIAIEREDEVLLDQLLKCEVKFDAQSPGGYGETPLILACQKGLKQTVKRLLQRGADVDYAADLRSDFDSMGDRLLVYTRTPLMVAALCEHTEIIKLLLRYGADPRIRTSDGTALELALRQGRNKRVINCLRRAEWRAQLKDIIRRW